MTDAHDIPAHDDIAAYANLGPDVILDAVETRGYRCDGRFFALNSFENRVYLVGLEQGDSLVAKFYRPRRWSDEAIAEEHAFALELAEHEIAVVAPLAGPGGETLHHHDGYRFALFPRQGGRAPSLEDPAQLEQLGRFLGRLHAVGASRAFRHRATLTVEGMGEASRRWILDSDMLPEYLREAYAETSRDLLDAVAACWRDGANVQMLRAHGDFHVGNVLWTDDGPHVVDLDDACMAPSVQDLWLFLSGDRDYRTARLHDLLGGYTMFREFDARELRLVEPLRALRMIYYAAWLARRWTDPAFPRAFPWFNTPRYWEEQVATLAQQRHALEEPPLAW